MSNDHCPRKRKTQLKAIWNEKHLNKSGWVILYSGYKYWNNQTGSALDENLKPTKFLIIVKDYWMLSWESLCTKNLEGRA